MALKETNGGRSAALLDFAPAEFAAAAQRQFYELAGAQTRLFHVMQETTQHWLDRAQAETTLASEFTSKLSSAKSIPDAITVCQNWGSRRFEMMAEDARHVVDDAQKFMQMSTGIVASDRRVKAPEMSS